MVLHIFLAPPAHQQRLLIVVTVATVVLSNKRFKLECATTLKCFECSFDDFNFQYPSSKNVLD